MNQFWRPRQPMTGLVFWAVAGVLVADRWPLSVLHSLWLVAAALLAVLVCRRTALCWVFVFAGFFALHTLRFHQNPGRLLSAHLEAPVAVRAVGIVWSEPEAPPFFSRTVKARFTLRLETLVPLENGPAFLGAGGALIQVAWAGPMPRYGDRVELVASAHNLEAVRNPGQFDFRAYLNRRGIYSELETRFESDCRVWEHGRGNPFQAFAFAASHWIQFQLGRDLEDAPEVRPLIESMVLGTRGDTPVHIKELFQRTGTMHLFAVSGLNVAMLGSMIWFLLKPLRVSRGAAVAVILPVLAVYALVTGLSASCLRATLMGALILVAYLVDRRPVFYNGLSAAAFFILAWDTNQLFSPGFQFSFVLVFTIVWLALRIQNRIEPAAMPDVFLPRPLWSVPQKVWVPCWSAFCATLGVTLAAWCGSLLFSAGYFHLFSLAAILANLLAVPLAFAVLGLGLLSVLSAGLGAGISILFNNANWAVAKLLLWVVEIFALLPGGHLYVEWPRIPAPPLELLVFDLGTGSATHLRAGGRDWLVDCGSDSRYGQSVLPYLRTRGVNGLEGFVLTHGDSQHIGAALAVLNDFSPRQILDSPLTDRSRARRAFHTELAARHRGKILCRRGDVFEVAPGVSMRVLFPPGGDFQRSKADDKALVLRIECEGLRVLLMSDSGFSTEQWLLENEPDLGADVLIAGRHESDASGSGEFLARVRPQALICEGPRFGQSAAELAPWQAGVRERGIALFAQEQTGAVSVILSRGGVFEVRAFLGAQTFRSRAR